MTVATYPLFQIGAYTFVAIPRIRSIDSVSTFSVQIFDDERDADICNNPIGWVSEQMRSMDAFGGEEARFATFKAAGISVKDILKAARAALG